MSTEPGRRREFNHDTRRWRAITAKVKDRAAAGEPCVYCRKAVDPTDTGNAPQSFTTAHWLSVRDHPHLAEDERNVRGPAHRGCNSRAGPEAGPLPLGPRSREW